MPYDEQALLNQCHPIFKFHLQRIVYGLRGLAWKPRIAELMRTPGQQADKVAKGFSKTIKSWHVPSTYGMLPAGKGAYFIVHGNAADIVNERYGWSGLASNTSFQFWQDLGTIARKEGCTWGGDWKKFKDVAHIEYKFIEEPPRTSLVV